MDHERAGLVGPKVVASGDVLLWVWTLIALGVTATVSVVLSARGLWSLRRRPGPLENLNRSSNALRLLVGAVEPVSRSTVWRGANSG